MNEREVAEYLLTTPDFFDRHTEVLDAIRLASPHGNRAVSLHERQLAQLREKNRQLERQLAELLRYGHENDGNIGKFNRWVAQLLAQADPQAMPAAIMAGLRSVFDVPQVAIRIWDIAPAYAQGDYARHVADDVRTFAASLTTPFCGANDGVEAARWLGSHDGAGESGHPCKSVALVCLRERHARARPETFGLLVMGSPDEARFHHGMATDLLTQIGTLASAALTRLRP